MGIQACLLTIYKQTNYANLLYVLQSKSSSVLITGFPASVKSLRFVYGLALFIPLPIFINLIIYNTSVSHLQKLIIVHPRHPWILLIFVCLLVIFECIGKLDRICK